MWGTPKMRLTKENTILGVLVLVGSAASAAGTLWGFTEQVFAGEIKAALTPVITTQRILLESDIASRRRELAALEFKRDTCRDSGELCWTVRDAQDLSNARAELIAREIALKSLQ